MDVFSQVATAARPHLASAALWAAHTLDLFSALASPLDVSTLASRRALSPHRLRALLEVLALEGHLARTQPDHFVAAGPRPRPPAPPPLGWGRSPRCCSATAPSPRTEWRAWPERP